MALGTGAAVKDGAADVDENLPVALSKDSVLDEVVNAGLERAFTVWVFAVSSPFNAVTCPYSDASDASRSSCSARNEKGFFPKVLGLAMMNSLLCRACFRSTNLDLFPDQGTASFWLAVPGCSSFTRFLTIQHWACF